MPTRAASAPMCLESVRLPAQELAALLTELDKHASQPDGADRRHTGPVPFRGHSPVIVRVHHADGSMGNYRVIPRNISAEGLGFLHGNYLHARTPCAVILRRLDSQPLQIAGTVVTCRHVRGTIHEVGVRFAKPIDLPSIQPVAT